MSRALLVRLRDPEPILSEQEVAELALSIGAPRRAEFNNSALHGMIEDALRHYIFDRWQQEAASSRTGKDANSIMIACDRILDTALVEPRKGVSRDNLQQHLGAGALFASAALTGSSRGEGAVMNALSAVQSLRSYAKIAKADAGRRFHKKGKPPNAALKAMVARLGECYLAGWSKPTVSRWGSVEDSPFVGFLTSINALLRSKGLDTRRSAESLAKIWDRLPPDPTDLVDRKL